MRSSAACIARPGVTHTLDSSGFRTQFEARKEIWFGSIPLADQGAVPVRLSF